MPKKAPTSDEMSEPKKKLTDREILNAKIPEGQDELSLNAGPGLYIRHRANKDRDWFIWYTSPVDKKRTKYFFAAYPDTTLEDARIAAAKYRRQIRVEFLDPKREAAQTKLIEDLGEAPATVEELALIWKQKELKDHEDGGDYAYGVLERHALPALGQIELGRLRQPMIAAVLDRVKDTGKKVTTGKVLGYLRQMFGYAVQRGWLQGDPTAGMQKVKWAGPRKRGDRVLMPDEITELSGKLVDAEFPPELECALWIMLAGITRVGETGLAQHKHVIDWDTGIWFIPPLNQKKTKSGRRPHWVDLSPFALKWFRRLLELHQERAIRANNRLSLKRRLAAVPKVEVEFLFPAQKRPGAINEKTITKAVHARMHPVGTIPLKGRTPQVSALLLDGGPWTPHDLRRTGSTMMREVLDVPQDVIERCLNHVPADELIATYQHAKLRPQMRAAWLQWGDYLDAIVQRQPRDVRYIEAAEEEEDI